MIFRISRVRSNFPKASVYNHCAVCSPLGQSIANLQSQKHGGPVMSSTNCSGSLLVTFTGSLAAGSL